MEPTVASAPSIPHPSAAPALDEGGFLIDPQSWSPELGQSLAELRGLGPLSQAHWQVIYFVRAKYLRLGSLPTLRAVCRGTGNDRSTIHGLFGSCATLLQVAGLPDPGEEAKAYFP